MPHAFGVIPAHLAALAGLPGEGLFDEGDADSMAVGLDHGMWFLHEVVGVDDHGCFSGALGNDVEQAALHVHGDLLLGELRPVAPHRSQGLGRVADQEAVLESVEELVAPPMHAVVGEVL